MAYSLYILILFIINLKIINSYFHLPYPYSVKFNFFEKKSGKNSNRAKKLKKKTEKLLVSVFTITELNL